MQTDPTNTARGDPWSGDGIAPSFLPRIDSPDRTAQAPLAIGDMADLFGVTHRTLHFYEEKGLISAERIGAMRVYDHGNIRRMAVICACREIGISLAVIQELMQELGEARTQEEADALFHRTLDRRRRELSSDLSSISRQIQQIRTLVTGDTVPDAEKIDMRPSLSSLERRCLVLMTEGYKGTELAEKLGIEAEALVQLEEALIEKLAVGNRFQAAAKAILLGILPH